jgi:hypothetical protein
LSLFIYLFICIFLEPYLSSLSYGWGLRKTKQEEYKQLITVAGVKCDKTARKDDPLKCLKYVHPGRQDFGRGFNHPVVVKDEEEDEGKEVPLLYVRYGAHTGQRKGTVA